MTPVLVKLLPEQISKTWQSLAWAIMEALPPFVEATVDRLDYILKQLMTGGMQCWVASYAEDGKTVAVMTTAIAVDPCSGARNLVIFSLYSVQPIGQDLWQCGYEALQLFARVNTCSQVVAYTDVPHIVETAKKYGAAIRQFLSIPVM